MTDTVQQTKQANYNEYSHNDSKTIDVI